MIDRVVTERARGVRTTLPDGRPARPQVIRPSVLAASVGILVAGAAFLDGWPSPEPTDEPPTLSRECGMTRDLNGLVTVSALFLSVACGQEPGGPLAGPVPPAAELDLRALKEGSWTYEIVGRDGLTRSRATFSLSRVSTGNAHGWLGVESRQAVASWRAVTDSLFLDADGLTPLRRVYRAARDGRDLRIVTTTYGPDSIGIVSQYLGYGSSPPAQSDTAHPWRADLRPIITPAHAPGWGFAHIVRLLPLEQHWAGAVYVAGYWIGGFGTQSLEVAGEERVRVPAGVFDCWRVVVQSAFTEQSDGQRWLTLWVAKDTRTLVRAILGPKGAEGSGLAEVLVSEANSGG
jgi:hypothetical protein